MAIKTTKGTMTSGKVKYNGTVYSIKEIYFMKDSKEQVFFKGVKDPYDSPGGKYMKAGTMDRGWFGEVPEEDLITSTELDALVGLDDKGIAINEQGRSWLKFAHNGKIIFKARRPFKHTISYADIFGKVNVGKKVVIKNKTYVCRFMQQPDEWESLMFPLDNGEWEKWHNYYIGVGFGKGQLQICHPRTGMGGGEVSKKHTIGLGDKTEQLGWCPVLELIE